MNIDNHRVRQARQVPSQNCDARPLSCDIDTIVVHSISLPPGHFGGCHIDELFTNCLNPQEHHYFAEISDLKVSAHVLVNRLGELTQYVAFNERAWHAGQSGYLGRERFNDFSIGIELEGTDDGPFESIQYVVLARLIVELSRSYPSIRRSNIVGHSTIAPTRKTDPGPFFDWDKLDLLIGYMESLKATQDIQGISKS